MRSESGDKVCKVRKHGSVGARRCSQVLVALTLLWACAEPARYPVEAGIGPRPNLPAPAKALVPTVKIAKAKGWAEHAMPIAATGTRVNAFATGLNHPRFLYVLPNGDVLVAETNAPAKPDDNKGFRGKLFNYFQKKAGAAVPSANRILLLRDADGDGVAETHTEFLAGLNSPFGIALIGKALYVANTDAVFRFPYDGGETRISRPGVLLTALPAGTINHHWTKTIVRSVDGARLYVSIGSNSNVAENGIAAEAGRAEIWSIDTRTGAHTTYATGLRNAAGLAIEPASGALWAAVNERDELGGDLVPDYMTAVRAGGFYGWPYSYFGQHVDDRVKPQRPDLVAKAIVPDYALGAHTASLGLATSQGIAIPAYSNGMFVGQHGSWNRDPPSGYKVIFVPFTGGMPLGMPVDVLTGFLDRKGNAMGRPVGVAVDTRGSLLVADDVGNVVWRVSSVQMAAGSVRAP